MDPGDQGDGDQTMAFDRAQDRIPRRADTTGEHPAPGKRQHQYAHPTVQEVDLLYLSHRTEAERAGGVPPGVIAGTRHTLDQLDEGKEHGTCSRDGQPDQERARDWSRRKTVRRVVRW